MHVPNSTAANPSHRAVQHAQLAQLESGLEALLSKLFLKGKISWRIKSADSTLGKLILRAIDTAVANPQINQSPNHQRTAFTVRDSEHACQLIADNHQQLHAFVKTLSEAPTTHQALMDQLGLRIVLKEPASAQDCQALAGAIKLHISAHARAGSNSALTSQSVPELSSFSLNPAQNTEKDYISHPKANGYQSLHMSLLAHDTPPHIPKDTSAPDILSLPIEIQIRTEKMDATARQGDAQHDAYKENQRLLLKAFKAYYGLLGTNQPINQTTLKTIQALKDAAQQGCAL